MGVEPTTKTFYEDQYTREISAKIISITADQVILDRTVFYPIGGGQPGDVGRLELDNGRSLNIVDTKYRPGRLRIAHCAEAAVDPSLVGASVVARVDWGRRYPIMRIHTALHLLTAVNDYPVVGCKMDEKAGSLDFQMGNNPFDVNDIEGKINELASKNAAVSSEYWAQNEVTHESGLVRTPNALPPADNGVIRVVTIGEIDRQACGGTHVKNIGEIGEIKIVSSTSKGKGVRRIKIESSDS